MKPHKHAELIKAWADGAEIQVYTMDINPKTNVSTPVWVDVAICDVIEGDWSDAVFRIKPEPKPDVVYKFEVDKYKHFHQIDTVAGMANLKLTFDGETGELKSAEVLK